MPSIFWNQRQDIFVHRVFLLLDWDCKSLCFHNSLDNTPTYPWITLVQSNTSYCWLWLVRSSVYSLQQDKALSVSLLSVLYILGIRLGFYFSLFSGQFPWTACPSSDAPTVLITKEGSMPHSSHFGLLHQLFSPPGMEPELSSSFCGLFPICQPTWRPVFFPLLLLTPRVWAGLTFTRRLPLGTSSGIVCLLNYWS